MHALISHDDDSDDEEIVVDGDDDDDLLEPLDCSRPTHMLQQHPVKTAIDHDEQSAKVVKPLTAFRIVDILS